MIYQAIFASLALSSLVFDRGVLGRPLLWIWSLLLLVFIGWREWTGCDFAGYLGRFSSYVIYEWEFRGLAAEPGFELLNRVAIGQGLGYIGVNVLSAALLMGCVLWFVQQREAPLRYLAIFFPILIVQLGMSGIRQASALALLMVAFDMFTQRRAAFFVIFVLLASSFHVSAIMFLPLAFMVRSGLTAPMAMLGLVLTLPLIQFLFAERIDVYNERYFEGEASSGGAILRTALLLISATGFEFWRTRYKRMFPQDFELMRVFSILSFGTAVLLLFSTLAAHRIGYYIMPVHLLMLARLPVVIGNGRPQAELKLLPFVIYGGYCVGWFSLSRHAQLCYIPYQSYLY